MKGLIANFLNAFIKRDGLALIAIAIMCMFAPTWAHAQTAIAIDNFCLASGNIQMNIQYYDGYPAGLQMYNVNPYDPAQANNLGVSNNLIYTIVACLDQSIRYMTITMLGSVSDAMLPVALAFFTLAIAFHGIRLMGGEGDPIAKTAGFLLRVGLVSVFFYFLGGSWDRPQDGMVDDVFLITDELAYIIIGNFNPWWWMDRFIGNLLGYGAAGAGDANNANDARELYQGVMGMVAAALLAGSTGVLMMGAAVMAIIEMILFVLDIVYCYLTAIMIIALALIISPLIIPLALFGYTEQYFKKWLHVLLGAMLVPMFLLGFLYMTLDVFEYQTQDVLCRLDPARWKNSNCAQPFENPSYDYSQYWRMNVPLFSWLMPTSPAFNRQLAAMNPGEMPQVPPIANTISPSSKNSANLNAANTWGLHYGPENDKEMINIMFGFIAMWIYASILQGMIRKMPEVAQHIAGVTAHARISSVPLAARANEAMSNLKVGGGAIIGGVVGNQVGRAISRRGGRQVSTQVGSMIGALVGKRS